jgi:hypothetical protein
MRLHTCIHSRTEGEMKTPELTINCCCSAMSEYLIVYAYVQAAVFLYIVNEAVYFSAVFRQVVSRIRTLIVLSIINF